MLCYNGYKFLLISSLLKCHPGYIKITAIHLRVSSIEVELWPSGYGIVFVSEKFRVRAPLGHQC